ncbi:MAG: hypothetical protein EXR39_17730 [Betaproteobacteria bacterium]|nr:hypothetical protein [Betaproteobacteria bacterium]
MFHSLELSPYLFVAYVIWLLVISGGLILQRRSPVATLGWLFALLALPYVGILVWILFGPRRVARRRLHFAIIRSRVERATIDFRKGAFATDLGEEMCGRFRQLITLAGRLRQPPPARAEEVELYFDGDSCYARSKRQSKKPGTTSTLRSISGIPVPHRIESSIDYANAPATRSR